MKKEGCERREKIEEEKNSATDQITKCRAEEEKEEEAEAEEE